MVPLTAKEYCQVVPPQNWDLGGYIHLSSPWAVHGCPCLASCHTQIWALQPCLTQSPQPRCRQSFRSCRKGRQPAHHLQATKELSNPTVFLCSITPSTVTDSHICQGKGLYTSDMGGVVLLPSGHWGGGYFGFTSHQHYLRSVSKQLSKILGGMFPSNFLLECVGEQWMWALCCTTGTFGSSRALAQHCHTEQDSGIVLRLPWIPLS